jgi:hypothetical protein
MSNGLVAAINLLHRYADQGERNDSAYRKIDEAAGTLRAALLAGPRDTIPRAWMVEQADGAVLGIHNNPEDAEHHLTLAAPGSRIVPLVPLATPTEE